MSNVESKQKHIDREVSSMNKVAGSITYFGKDHQISFMLKDEDKDSAELSFKMGFPIAGIIGAPFIANQGWAINFDN